MQTHTNSGLLMFQLYLCKSHFAVQSQWSVALSRSLAPLRALRLLGLHFKNLVHYLFRPTSDTLFPPPLTVFCKNIQKHTAYQPGTMPSGEAAANSLIQKPFNLFPQGTTYVHPIFIQTKLRHVKSRVKSCATKTIEKRMLGL